MFTSSRRPRRRACPIVLLAALLAACLCCGLALAQSPGLPSLFALFSFDGSGSPAGTLTRPRGVAIGPHPVNTEGQAAAVYVTDTGNDRVQVFDAEGTFVLTWGSAGQEPGRFDEPWGVALSGAQVLVSDYGNDRIQRFAAGGAFLGEFGSPGFDPGEFDGPAGIAVDVQGRIYVADSGNDRVQVFDATGGYLFELGDDFAPGRLDGPLDVTVDGLGRILVADTDNGRIAIYSSNGAYLTSIGDTGDLQERLVRPAGVAVDGLGDVLVSDRFDDRVVRYSQSGAFLAELGGPSSGSGLGQFVDPTGLAVGDGRLYVADTLNNRIQVLALAPLEIPVPHLTGGDDVWSESLEVDNLAEDLAAGEAYFGLALYNQGQPVSETRQSVQPGGRLVLDVSGLAPSATTGLVTAAAPGLTFRLVYTSATGGVVQVVLTPETSAAAVALFAQDVAFVDWKGAAFMQAAETQQSVRLEAWSSSPGGPGQVLATQDVVLGPWSRLVGTTQELFPGLGNPLAVQRITAQATGDASAARLSGLAISGNWAGDRLLFAPALPDMPLE